MWSSLEDKSQTSDLSTTTSATLSQIFSTTTATGNNQQRFNQAEQRENNLSTQEQNLKKCKS